MFKALSDRELMDKSEALIRGIFGHANKGEFPWEVLSQNQMFDNRIIQSVDYRYTETQGEPITVISGSKDRTSFHAKAENFDRGIFFNLQDVPALKSHVLHHHSYISDTFEGRDVEGSILQLWFEEESILIDIDISPGYIQYELFADVSVSAINPHSQQDLDDYQSEEVKQLLVSKYLREAGGLMQGALDHAEQNNIKPEEVVRLLHRRVADPRFEVGTMNARVKPINAARLAAVLRDETTHKGFIHKDPDSIKITWMMSADDLCFHLYSDMGESSGTLNMETGKLTISGKEIEVSSLVSPFIQMIAQYAFSVRDLTGEMSGELLTTPKQAPKADV